MTLFVGGESDGKDLAVKNGTDIVALPGKCVDALTGVKVDTSRSITQLPNTDLAWEIEHYTRRTIRTPKRDLHVFAVQGLDDDQLLHMLISGYRKPPSK